MSEPFAPHMNREHLKALWDAYFQATGFPALTASHARILTLKDIDRRGITPEEIGAVIQGIQRAIAEKRNGFNEASLEWENAMAKVDKLESRVTRYRQAVSRRTAAAPKASAPTEAPALSTEDEEHLRQQRKKEIAKLKEQIGR